LKSGFATKLSNVRRFFAAMDTAEQRGADEAGWVLARGEPGYGKTGTLFWYAAQPRSEAIYIRVMSVWSRKALMGEIVRALGGEPHGHLAALVGQATRLLLEKPRTLVIDETEHTLGRDMRMLEAVRDVSDFARIPVVIGGRAHIEERIARHRQFASRICAVARFEPLDAKDIGELTREISDYEFTADAIELVAAQAKGSLRLARNAIAAAERIARRKGSGKTLKSEMLEGATLAVAFDAAEIARGGAR